MRTLLPSLILAGSLTLVATAQETARSAPPARTAQEANKASPAAVVETQGDNVREASGSAAAGTRRKASPSSPQTPLISFIDSPSATCYQPDPLRDACYVNWYYSSVDGNPNYMVNLIISLNGNVVARTAGFFQTSMYVPYNMFGMGFRVPCGTLGSGGDPTLGSAYSWTINAKDSAALTSANYGTVYCPAFIPSP